MTTQDLEYPPAAQHGEDRAQTIRDRLRNAIMEQRLGPGAKLVESDIGALFDVSRTIARSALQMLAFEGLVRIERNRGAFVANPSPDEARQVFASRRVVEAGVATEACLRVTSADIDLLREHLATERRYMNERGAVARRSEIMASGEFHLVLARISGNAILLRFMEELIARSSLVIALYGRSGASSCGHNEHEQIVEALARGDADKVRSLMLQHIEHIEVDLDLKSGSLTSLKAALDL